MRSRPIQMRPHLPNCVHITSSSIQMRPHLPNCVHIRHVSNPIPSWRVYTRPLTSTVTSTSRPYLANCVQFRPPTSALAHMRLHSSTCVHITSSSIQMRPLASRVKSPSRPDESTLAHLRPHPSNCVRHVHITSKLAQLRPLSSPYVRVSPHASKSRYMHLHSPTCVHITSSSIQMRPEPSTWDQILSKRLCKTTLFDRLRLNLQHVY